MKPVVIFISISIIILTTILGVIIHINIEKYRLSNDISCLSNIMILGQKYIDTRLISNISQYNLQLLPFTGRITWSCNSPYGLVLCNEPSHYLILWDINNNNVINILTLEHLKKPVGCQYIDNLLYVCCFGGSNGTSGIAVFDLNNSSSTTPKNIYQYTKFPDHYLHNISQLTLNGRKHIIVCDLGNPWSNPPQKGNGLLIFENAFNPLSNINYNARSVAQSPINPSIILCLTQKPTILYKIIDGVIQTQNKIEFSENNGDGGADVFFDPTGIAYCSIRYGNNKPGEIFSIDVHKMIKTHSFFVGRNPRYTKYLPDNKIISCNQDDNTISVYKIYDKKVTTYNTSVEFPSFIIEIK
jgi:hypothetical protein